MIALVCCLSLVIGALVCALWMRRPTPERVITARLRKQVVVEVKSGETFRGLLVECDSNLLVLRSAQAISSPEAAGLILDGELILARSDVKWLQRP